MRVSLPVAVVTTRAAVAAATAAASIGVPAAAVTAAAVPVPVVTAAVPVVGKRGVLTQSPQTAERAITNEIYYQSIPI